MARRCRRAGASALVMALVLVGCGASRAMPVSRAPAAPASAVGRTTTTRPPMPRTTTSRPAASGPTSAASASECTNVAVVAGWSLSRRAAQLIVAPDDGLGLQDLESVVSTGVGGVLLLGSSTPPDLARQIRTAALVAPHHLAPMVMADEEGGGVQRLVDLVGPLPWARVMAATMTPDEVETAATEVGRRMRDLGVGMDLAPVLDIDGGHGPDSSDPDGLRSFSPVPAKAARYGIAFLQGLAQAGVVPVVKHFPGLGGASENTDEGPASTPALSELEDHGLLPFQAAIAAGAPAVMVANASVPGLATGPASLSPAVVTGLLGGRLGFHGLVLTDSLSAGAISAAGYDLPRAAVAAVGAGGDLVLFGSTLTPAQTALLSSTNVVASTTEMVAALVGAVESGALSTVRLDHAVVQVLAAKGVHLCSPASPG